jgi:hypothetical protein
MKSGNLWMALIVAAVVMFALFRLRNRSLPPPPRTVDDVLVTIGSQIDTRLRPDFQKAGVSYPPGRVLLLAFKKERRLDVLAGEKSGPLRWIRSIPILGASGMEGPKLREGDRQVPEGFYRIELLNPNSRYHLSLRVDYPNAEDRARAVADGRDLSTLGGDIMIHGGEASVGCLALGDPAAEELFVLAARAGLDALELQIFPWDLRMEPPPKSDSADMAGLYERLKKQLEKLP